MTYENTSGMFFFSSRRRHTRYWRDWSSDVCSSDLAPGFFTSEMTDTYPEGYIEGQMSRVLAGRKGDPMELAAALVFLVSDAGGYVTGTTLPVEGGLLTS